MSNDEPSEKTKFAVTLGRSARFTPPPDCISFTVECLCPFCSGMLNPIMDREHYERAVARVMELTAMDPDPGSPLSTELFLLVLTTEKYEDVYLPIETPTPADAIKFRMEQLELTPAAVAGRMGWSTELVLGLLDGSVELDLPMIRQLYEKMHIPLECLIREQRRE